MAAQFFLGGKWRSESEMRSALRRASRRLARRASPEAASAVGYYELVGWRALAARPDDCERFMKLAGDA